MKKVTFLLATLLIGSIVFTGCKKDNNASGDSTSKTFKVSYALENTATVEGVVAAFDVKAPFTAKVEAKPVYNEADLPDEFVYGANAVIYKDGAESMRKNDIYKRIKVKFLQTAQESPEELIIKTEREF